MLYLMKAGGFSMWIVLLFGLILLISAGLFAWRPSEGRLGFVRAMTWAEVFAILSGVASDLAATFYNVNAVEEWAQSDDVHLIVMMGVSESMSPAILGFTMLALAWLMTAVGIRRLAASD